MQILILTRQVFLWKDGITQVWSTISRYHAHVPCFTQNSVCSRFNFGYSVKMVRRRTSEAQRRQIIGRRSTGISLKDIGGLNLRTLRRIYWSDENRFLLHVTDWRMRVWRQEKYGVFPKEHPDNCPLRWGLGNDMWVYLSWSPYRET